MSEEQVLIPEENGTDYTLPEERWVWLTAGLLSVFVRHSKGGVTVTVFERGKEADTCIINTWTAFPTQETGDV